MGGCASRPEGRVDLSKKKKDHTKRRRRRRWSKRRVSYLKLDNNVASSCAPPDGFRCKSIIKGSAESTWFDRFSSVGSELAEEFHSACDDVFSINGSEIASTLSVSSPRDVNQTNQPQKRAETVLENSERNSGDGDKNVRMLDLQRKDSQLKTNDTQNDVTTNTGGDDKQEALNNYGLVPNACLPFLNSTVPSVEKRRTLSPRTPSSRKKVASKVSFKWSEGHSNSALFSPKAIQKRPLAGSSVPFCPLEKAMPNCWKHIEPRTFKVRGQNYFRDKKKDFAPNYAAFCPFGVDVFLSQRKIDHIARFVELPVADSYKEFPAILVVNIQIPLYPATIFQNENDGEGMNVVLYFKLAEGYLKELPSHFQENIHRLINDEMERVKSFPVDTISPFRERLKILGRVANVEDLHLSTAEKKLMSAYNEKPLLSRPQHEFYLGENYFEIDLDIHRFSYVARKGFESFHERTKLCTLDFGLTIQGNKAEDLPENMLCCIRLNKIDYTTYQPLEF